jgi:hypothetical protein
MILNLNGIYYICLICLFQQPIFNSSAFFHALIVKGIEIVIGFSGPDASGELADSGEDVVDRPLLVGVILSTSLKKCPVSEKDRANGTDTLKVSSLVE